MFFDRFWMHGSFQNMLFQWAAAFEKLAAEAEGQSGGVPAKVRYDSLWAFITWAMSGQSKSIVNP